MPKKKRIEEDPNVDLLQKMLVFQLYTLKVPQERIAKTVGRQMAWVNDLLKGIPKGGKSDANQAKAKKAKKRSRS
jgi:hypothetical protein